MEYGLELTEKGRLDTCSFCIEIKEIRGVFISFFFGSTCRDLPLEGENNLLTIQRGIQ